MPNSADFVSGCLFVDLILCVFDLRICTKCMYLVGAMCIYIVRLWCFLACAKLWCKVLPHEFIEFVQGGVNIALRAL